MDRTLEELLSRGVEASGIVVLDDRDGGTVFGFSDPDGNSWTVQELRARAGPGCVRPDTDR